MSFHRRRIDAGEWIPIDVAALEQNALIVVKSEDNRSVIAGPGAGKTELLAQRAAFLLQTGASPHPRRILAISFKRDAATNLSARVRKRCHPEMSRRFDSMTFDAFAKSLVDRFGQALPETWRPSSNYRIDFPNSRAYENFLATLGNPPPEVGSRAELEAIRPREFERSVLFGAPLRRKPPVEPDVEEWAAQKYWRSMLGGRNGSVLTFPIISRLAELLIRVNQSVKQALVLTYSHVFLDEFQDTTHLQYELMRSIFRGSPTVLTAVGDNKQQIMRWAMAMADPFAAFERDFSATRTPLLNNYRSSPELVRIQHVLAQALDAGAVEAVSQAASGVAGESCEVWDFQNTQAEAATIATFIQEQMFEHGLGPRDFVVLVRQKASDYMGLLLPALAAHGIPLRNEAADIGPVRLQELLAEELSEVVVQILRLVASDRVGRGWCECVETLAFLQGAMGDDDRTGRLARDLAHVVESLRARFPQPNADLVTVTTLIDVILTFCDRAKIASAYPAYRQGEWMTKVSEAIALHMRESSAGQGSWTEALDRYEGKASLPLMTIHKSKGLEYHTVIFLGLDDDAWWSFSGDAAEATAGFFVAFTRAKQRVLFTYCASRGTRRKIAALYELLRLAGVGTVKK